jgi:hypothetical protein
LCNKQRTDRSQTTSGKQPSLSPQHGAHFDGSSEFAFLEQNRNLVNSWLQPPDTRLSSRKGAECAPSGVVTARLHEMPFAPRTKKARDRFPGAGFKILATLPIWR